MEEKYTPVRGFNGEEVKEYMKKGALRWSFRAGLGLWHWSRLILIHCTAYQDAIAGDINIAARYKVSEEGTTAKAAWGQKPSTMANGQDFWVHLKKQVVSGQ